MRVYSAAETTSLLPYPALAEAIADVLRRARAGEAAAPKRVHLPLASPSGRGMLLVMPAADARLSITKLVTVHPDNPGLGLPTIQGEVLVMDAATGRRLGILDGPALTARRTAALSLLAARLLAPSPDGPLLLVGAGVQAEAHLEAFRDGLGIRRVLVASRGPEGAARLAVRARELGLEATVVECGGEGLREALAEATLVVTATTSHTPVLPEAGLRPDAFVAAVGAFTPRMAEIPAGVMQAARVVIDTRDGLSEAGDIVQAGLDPARITPLTDLLDAPPAPDGRPVVFKSVGHALFDLAAAVLAMTGEASAEGPSGGRPAQSST
jgi:ornithine cyclodeaminase